MNTKLIYKRTRKASQNPEKRFSKTGDFFIAIGEALSSKNSKAELDKLAKKYDMQRKDLKEAVETYIKYDLDSNGLDDNDVKHLLKDAGFSDNDNESEEVKEFTHRPEYYRKKNDELYAREKDIQHRISVLKTDYDAKLNKIKDDYQKKLKKLDEEYDALIAEKEIFGEELHEFLYQNKT